MSDRASNDAFRVSLADALRPLTVPVEIQAAATRVLARHLNATRALYAEVVTEPDGDLYAVRQDYCAPGVPSMVGTYRADDFGATLFNEMRAGRTLVVSEVSTDLRLTDRERASYPTIAVVSYVTVPLVKKGQHVAFLAVAHSAPRTWTAEDVALIEETAERTWAAVERAHAETALGRSEAQYRELFSLIDQCIIIFEQLSASPDGRHDYLCVACNPATLKLFGVRDFVGSTARSTFLGAPEDWYDALDNVVATGETCSLVRDAVQGKLVLDVTFTHVQAMSSRRVMTVVRDITAQRRAEEELRASDDRKGFLLALSDALRPLTDTTEIQREAARLLGEHLDADWALYAEFDDEVTVAIVSENHVRRGAPSLVGRHPLHEFPGLVDALRAGEPITIEDLTTSALATVTGRLLYQDISLRALATVPVVKKGALLAAVTVLSRTPRGWTEREVGLIEDTAERTWAAVERARAEASLRETQAILREREERLQENDRRKDEFIAMLAHELRNPLAPIRTGLEVIRLAQDTGESVARVRGMMERQVSHMVRLIDDLLDVSRVSSGKIRLQRQPTPVARLIDTAVEANRAAIDARPLTLSVDLPPAPVVLDVDPTRFVQVVSNLLHNAVKFTEPPGEIHVVGRLVEGFELTVTDSGIGISKEALPRVFDLFAQGEPSEKGSHSGLGIGLALARRLVEMHGGTIEASSPGAGLGSMFRIVLPLAAVVTESVSPSLPPPSDAPKRRVLVIDDNKDAADLIAMLVSKMGGEARVAYDGENGLARIGEFDPDVVLLDIGMPGIDGYETCRRIRNVRGPELRVVAITGFGQENDKEKAKVAGFDAHLTKPVDLVALRRVLETPTRRSAG